MNGSALLWDALVDLQRVVFQLDVRDALHSDGRLLDPMGDRIARDGHARVGTVSVARDRGLASRNLYVTFRETPMPRSTKMKTAFDKFVNEQMTSRSFAKNYAEARAEVDAIDSMVRALDAAREKSGLTKAELAAAIDARPEVVRRLFTTKVPNPTLSTIIRLAAAVGYRIELVPDAKPKKASRRNAIV